MKFKNGDEVVDKVSHFSGVVTGICEYLGEESRSIRVTAYSEKGSTFEEQWIQEPRLEKFSFIKASS